VRLGHDIETGDPINVSEHARTVHAAMKRQARLMDQDGSCDILAHAQGLYEAATGEVHRDEGLRTRREQLAASRQRN
jgi:hypothetical protein